MFKRGITTVDHLRVGKKLTGQVANVVSFGAFVDVGVGKDGLIHISKMKGKQVVRGNKVEVAVVSVRGSNGHKPKISLELLRVLWWWACLGPPSTSNPPQAILCSLSLKVSFPHSNPRNPRPTTSLPMKKWMSCCFSCLVNFYRCDWQPVSAWSQVFACGARVRRKRSIISGSTMQCQFRRRQLR